MPAIGLVSLLVMFISSRSICTEAVARYTGVIISEATSANTNTMPTVATMVQRRFIRMCHRPIRSMLNSSWSALSTSVLSTPGA